ncbi:TetR/AcrR family transcriptional regulator [Streptomyces cavernicola]|uniref:Helix-turn-helix domain-containing protein n=1 Tax=Streptomyces cavernicola TaxID=3043613 RepID=A0ABT6SE63_9ACTN|nr:TetR/AcrR family transcriptional regulator [Streptomyces sp. B-S-A6]MDI3405758.1 helix-turn-helix domain-containing protein [Streptomyces sp. B-S-A6]
MQRSGSPLRKDAQRNRELVLAAAREVYAEQGVEAPLDVIARRAGVGNATLYRRFPDRAALIEAVFHATLASVIEAGEEARRAEDPWAGLNGYLDRVFTVLAADRGANDLMTTGIEGVPTLERLHVHNAETFAGLLDRCRDRGLVRADVVTEDLLLSLAAVGRAAPALEAAVPGSWRRPLALLIDGLRAEGAHPLPTEPLTSDQLTAVLGELNHPRG